MFLTQQYHLDKKLTLQLCWQDKTTHRRQDDSPTILTTKREALSLYREIMRITALFDWSNEHGMLWRDVLRQSAREEFEQARHERDPEIVNRLLVVGRDAVHQVAEKFIEKRKHIHGGSADPPRH